MFKNLFLFFSGTFERYLILKLNVPGFGGCHGEAGALRTSAVVKVVAELNHDCSGQGCLASATTNQHRRSVGRQKSLEVGLISTISSGDPGTIISSGRYDCAVFKSMFAIVVTSSVTTVSSLSSVSSVSFGTSRNDNEEKDK